MKTIMDDIQWLVGLSVDADGNTEYYRRNPDGSNTLVPNARKFPMTDPIITDNACSDPYLAAQMREAARVQALCDYEVKSWPWFFEPMCAGKKKHDMRDKRDRDYKVGDRMLLREWDPRTSEYTGRQALAYITYITSNDAPCAMSSNALDRNACILSVDVTELGDTDRWA